MEALKTSNKAVGSKQVKKAIVKGMAEKVFIAEDAEHHVTKALIDLAAEHGVQVEYVETMEKLGKACGIAVGSATAALLHD